MFKASELTWWHLVGCIYRNWICHFRFTQTFQSENSKDQKNTPRVSTMAIYSQNSHTTVCTNLFCIHTCKKQENSPMGKKALAFSKIGTILRKKTF